MTDSGEGKVKKVKTESGNWIPASYKSNLYPFVYTCTLAWHQFWSVGSSLGWGLNFQTLVCGIPEASHQRFSLGTPVSSPPSLINCSANKIQLK